MERISFRILVDFDNASNWTAIFDSHKPVKDDAIIFIDNLINQALNVIDELNIQVHEIWIRLYGGWHSSKVGGATELYNLLKEAKESTPLRRHGKSVRIDIVQGFKVNF